MNPESVTPQPLPVNDQLPMAPTEPQQTSGPHVPASWEGAFGAYKYSKAAISSNVGPYIVILIIYILINGVGSILSKSVTGFGGSSVDNLLSLLVGLLFALFTTVYYLASVRGQKLSFSEIFSKISEPVMWLKLFGLTIIIGLSLAVSLILFVIPFFFLLPRLSLANYFLIDKKMGVMDSYKASFAATKGNAGKVWGLIGVCILMSLLFITIIGIPFAIYFLFMYSAAFALLYEVINKTPAFETVPTSQSAPQPAAPTSDAPPAPEVPQTAAPQPPQTPPLVQ